MKPGWKTTEFWLAVAAGIGPTVADIFTPDWRALIVAVATAAYSIGRSIVKAKQAKAP